MSYQVIARKWRPQTFEEVIGQDAITRTLRNAIEHDRLHHAYLFSGARGVGKTTTARILAKALNCRKTETPNAKPCDTGNDDACDSCKEVTESRSLDVFEFDAASHTGVDDIREIILESINVNPARDRFKVFIIDEVHMLTRNSFNALLKTIEEPPSTVVFIMATTELHKVPDTILSRCQQFDFRTIAIKKIFGRLKEISEAEDIHISDDALREISRSGEGSMRDAQSNFDQVISFSGESIETADVISALGIASAENLTKTIESIAEKNTAQALNVVEDLVERGQDLRNFCRDLLTFVRDLLVVKIAGDSEDLLESAILNPDELKEQSSPFIETDLIRFFNSIAETESKMRDATEPRYLLEIGLIKLIEMRKLAPVEDIISRLSGLENAISSLSEDTPAESVKSPPPQEKKTLVSETEPRGMPFPVHHKGPERKETRTKVSFDESKSEKTLSAAPLPADDSSKVSGLSPLNTTQIEATSEPVSAPITIDAESMPVKLEPISAEELEHVEDKRLDNEFEERLLQEGDDLSVTREPGKLLDLLLNREGSVTAKTASDTPGIPVAAGTAAAPAKQNKALEIVAQMTDVEEINDMMPPPLSEEPDEDELRRYADNHPLVKKVKRIFRGKLVDVKRT
jgi:DNA polymerase-3 subunit gamma/tau